MSAIAFGHQSANRSSDLLLKAHLPGNNTVIKANGENTIRDVLNIISAKKELNADEYSIKLLLADSNQVEASDMTRKISEYDIVGVELYKPGAAHLEVPVGRSRNGRRSSIVVAPKETRTRSSSEQEFPRTVVNQAELVARLSKIPEYEASPRHNSSASLVYKTLSRFSKRKDAIDDSTFFADATGGFAAGWARSTTDLQPQMRKADGFRSASATALNSSSPSQESLTPTSRSKASAGSQEIAPSEEEETNAVALPLVCRTRTFSQPKSSGTSTFRRYTFQARGRAQSDCTITFDSESLQTGQKFMLAGPGGEVLTVQLPATSIMEIVLKYACERLNLDFQKFTLELPDHPFHVELDRNLNYYVKQSLPEFKVVEKQKQFSLKWVVEGDVDTMLLQLSGKEWLVMAATEDKLIERVTDGEVPIDLQFLDTLLLTYRSFMSPAEFYDRLLCRFNAELPPDPSPEDEEYFIRMKGPTQMRCIYIIQWWVEHHFQDFRSDAPLKEDLESVMIQIAEYPSCGERANSIIEALGRKTKEYEEMRSFDKAEHKRKSIQSLFMDIPVEELAQQLCLHDFKLFQNIQAIEYLNQIWRKPGDENSPGLDYFISRFDIMSYWLVTEVCSTKDKKARIKVLEKFILLAKLCQTYGNFFTMFALIAGLSLTPVTRLKATWEGISKPVRATHEELEKMADPSKNMKNYRDTLSATAPPIIPFLPIYLKDLTFINDGNELRIFNNMINFDKLRMMAKRVRDITDMTNYGYEYDAKPAVQNYLNKPTVERDLVKLKELSLECEGKV